MKIALVSSSSGSHGGGEFYLRELGAGLQKTGHTAELWASTDTHMDEFIQSCQGVDLPTRRIAYRNTYRRRSRSIGASFDRAGIRRLTEEFDACDADFIHLNLQCLEDGLDLIQAAAASSKPSLATVHVTRTAENLGARFGRIRDRWTRRIYQRAKVPCLAVSQRSAKDLSSFLGGQDTLQPNQSIPSENWSVPVYAVNNGVRIPVIGNRDELRASLGLPEDVFVIGVIARIEEQKNPLFLARLLSQLPDHVHCVWVGDGRWRDRLETDIKAARLSDRVHLIGWQSEAVRWLAAFDAFSLFSLYEGLPLSMLEAMANGLPCVVSQVDGTVDVVQHRRNGLLCPVNDVQAWASTYNELIRDKGQGRTIANTAKADHKDHFSIESMTQGTLAVYQQVCKFHRVHHVAAG